jgi:replication factor A3
MSETHPRINASLVPQFVGKTVRIIGKIHDLQGDTATLDASGELRIHLSMQSHVKENNYYEIIGKITDDHSIRMLDAIDFGDNISMYQETMCRYKANKTWNMSTP